MAGPSDSHPTVRRVGCVEVCGPSDGDPAVVRVRERDREREARGCADAVGLKSDGGEGVRAGEWVGLGWRPRWAVRGREGGWAG